MTLAACLGCGMLVSPGPRCAACQRRKDAIYNASRPAHHGIYRTARWRKLAAEVTAGATRCHWCLKPTRKLVADHIVPIDQHPSGAFDRGNLVPACFGCNNRRGRHSKLPDLEPAKPIPARRVSAPDRVVVTRPGDEPGRTPEARRVSGWPDAAELVDGAPIRQETP